MATVHPGVRSPRLQVGFVVPFRASEFDSEADDGLATQAATAELVQHLGGGG